MSADSGASFKARLCDFVLLVYLVTGALALPGALLLLGCQFDIIVIPSELSDSIFYSGVTLYGIAALSAGLVWMVRRVTLQTQNQKDGFQQ